MPVNRIYASYEVLFYVFTMNFLAQSLFLCDGSFLTYFLLLASMILRKKYSSSG